MKKPIKTRYEKVVVDHEPKYDDTVPLVWQDIVNVGYRGFGKKICVKVDKINDIRMITNYFLYLMNEETKLIYQRVKRDHEFLLARAAQSFLEVVSRNNTQPIPVDFVDERFVTASEKAIRLLEQESPSIVEVRNLAEKIQIHFYAHIDDFRDLV